jgi:hypothetical protein
MLEYLTYSRVEKQDNACQVWCVLNTGLDWVMQLSHASFVYAKRTYSSRQLFMVLSVEWVRLASRVILSANPTELRVVEKWLRMLITFEKDWVSLTTGEPFELSIVNESPEHESDVKRFLEQHVELLRCVQAYDEPFKALKARLKEYETTGDLSLIIPHFTPDFLRQTCRKQPEKRRKIDETHTVQEWYDLLNAQYPDKTDVRRGVALRDAITAAIYRDQETRVEEFLETFEVACFQPVAYKFLKTAATYSSVEMFKMLVARFVVFEEFGMWCDALVLCLIANNRQDYLTVMTLTGRWELTRDVQKLQSGYSEKKESNV